MAYWVNTGTQNFSASWDQVDSTSLNDSEAANTALTTSYVASTTFTPGVITVLGICVKLASVAASPTGTISVALDTAGSTVTGTEVIINVSDLPPCSTGTANNEGGWVYFYFAAPVTLAAVLTSVKAKTSSSSQVNLYSSATTNWARMLVTNTTGNPAAADQLNVCGQFTGAGAITATTVTMNNTTTTAYGVLTVNKSGTITYGVVASTAYVLRLGGNAIIYNGGIINIGTNGAAMPSTSSGVLEFNCGSVGQYGLAIRSGGQFVTQGNTVTTTNTTLTSDVAANASTFAVAAATGWANGDQVAIASTTRTPGDSELLTINISSLTATVTVGGGTGGNTVKNAHGGGGTANVIAEVIHITRNVKIRSVSSTNSMYIYLGSTGVITSKYTEFYYLGANVTGQRGIEFNTTGTCVVQYCSVHDCPNFGVVISNLNTRQPNNITFSNNVLWSLNTSGAASSYGFGFDGGTTGTAIVIDSNIMIAIQTVSNGDCVDLKDVGNTFTNNTIAGSGVGASSVGIDMDESSGAVLAFTGNTAHSNAGFGCRLNQSGQSGTVGTLTAWRNAAEGLRVAGYQISLILATATMFGNGSQNINITQNQGNVVFKSLTLNGDATFSTTHGILFSNSGKFIIIDSTFGSTVAHATDDFSLNNSQFVDITCFNCTLSSATQVTLNATGNTGSAVRLQRNGQTAAYKTIMFYGTITADATTRHTASGFSWKMTPNNASFKLNFPGPTPYDTIKAAVNASALVTITAWVYYDGTYNGNMPRLIIKGGVLQGIGSDVTATAPSSNANTWQQLTVTATPTEAGVIECIVDCDGTAGNVYVDDFAVSQ